MLLVERVRDAVRGWASDIGFTGGFASALERDSGVASVPMRAKRGARIRTSTARSITLSDRILRVEADSALQPWMRGPFELIRHAYGHFASDGDTDRRIALIGFDNAIEVSIDVYLRLPPRVRNGVEIAKAEKDHAIQNFHTKIEFLDKHVAARKLTLSVPVETLLWYHELRNELYHAGNGMVPERHVVAGALEGAHRIWRSIAIGDKIALLRIPGDGHAYLAHDDIFVESFDLDYALLTTELILGGWALVKFVVFLFARFRPPTDDAASTA